MPGHVRLPGEERATTHLTATRALGATEWYLLTRELLPAVLLPVVRHALLRLPGIVLNLAALSFLGLGAQPPSPEWGLLLAENQPYAEPAPWAVLVPAAVLALLGALAVTAPPPRRGDDGGTSEQATYWTWSSSPYPIPSRSYDMSRCRYRAASDGQNREDATAIGRPLSGHAPPVRYRQRTIPGQRPTL